MAFDRAPDCRLVHVLAERIGQDVSLWRHFPADGSSDYAALHDAFIDPVQEMIDEHQDRFTPLTPLRLGEDAAVLALPHEMVEACDRFERFITSYRVTSTVMLTSGAILRHQRINGCELITWEDGEVTEIVVWTGSEP